jgi:hypothetical protein
MTYVVMYKKANGMLPGANRFHPDARRTGLYALKN